MTDEYLYRFDGISRSSEPSYEFNSTIENINSCMIILSCYRITKRTPKGAWIDYGPTGKFVNLTKHKQFACTTKTAAMESFIARKCREINILISRLQNVRAWIQLAREGKYEQL